MAVIRVVYNEDGWLQIRLVPTDTLPMHYKKGILLGPPDLKILGLSETSTQTLNNILVESGFAQYPDLRSKRSQIVKILKGFFDSPAELKLARNNLLFAYQKEFYADIFSIGV